MEIPKISIITVGMNHLKYIGDLYMSVYQRFTPPEKNRTQCRIYVSGK